MARFSSFYITICICIFVSLRITIAEYTVAPTDASASVITCDQSDNCIVDCTNPNTTCDDYTINCQSGYSCTINCASCERLTVSAESVTDFEFSCSDNCNSAIIDTSLSTANSQFILNCYGTNESASNQYVVCAQMDITVSHTESIYTSSASNVDNVIVNCRGDNACFSLYIDSSVSGDFSAVCNGSNACSYTHMVYNPLLNTGIMDITCAGSNNKACYAMNVVSPAARKISVKCGEANITSAQYQSACSYLTILGAVFPFDENDTYAMNDIHSDSVYLECNHEECQVITLKVAFGSAQATIVDYVYNYSVGSSINYECGFDFASTGWNKPQRRISCDSYIIEARLIPMLNEGTNVVVTNRYMFDLSLNSEYSCETGKYCIIYSMERYNFREGPFWCPDYDDPFISYYYDDHSTAIICPTDGISHCEIYAVQPYALSLSVIDGTQSGLLLLMGVEYTSYTFSWATIYAPDTNCVNDSILFLEAGNAGGSFNYATFHAENTPLSTVGTVMGALIGARWFVNDTEWLQIECAYHNMCQDMLIFANHHSFNASGNHEDIIPNNVCIACSTFYTSSCDGVSLRITDVSTQQTHTFGTLWESDRWFWVNNDQSIKIPIAASSPYAGGGSNCTVITEEKIGSWYSGEGGKGINDGAPDCSNTTPDPSPFVCTETAEPTQHPTGAPTKTLPSFQCDWLQVFNFAPPLNDFCVTSWELSGGIKQKCVNGSIVVDIYEGLVNCTGSIIATYGAADGIEGDCSKGTQCKYATYEYKRSTEINATNCNNNMEFSGVLRNVVITDVCLQGEYWSCDVYEDGNELTKKTYADVDCSSSATEEVVYKEDMCHDYNYWSDIQCFDNNNIETTTTVTVIATTDEAVIEPQDTDPKESGTDSIIGNKYSYLVMFVVSILIGW